MKRALILTAFLGAAALASPKRIAVPVGHSLTVAMPAPVKSVKVANPSLVDVKQEGRKITLLARAKGTTEAIVKTADGETTFSVYIAEDKYAMPH